MRDFDLPPMLREIDLPLVESFAGVIDMGAEQAIHSFIESNPQILRFLSWDSILRSKLRLADAFIPDFVSIGISSWDNALHPFVTFVEIERADKSLFTKSGDPTSFLTHAIRQVMDWKHWMSENRSYAQSLIHREIAAERDRLKSHPQCRGDLRTWPQHLRVIFRVLAHSYDGLHFQDRYLIIGGRRESMKASDRLRLSQLGQQLNDIKIITYDAILEGLLRSIHESEVWRDIEFKDMSYS